MNMFVFLLPIAIHLWDLYGNSIALPIQSLDGTLSHSLAAHLITRYSLV